MTSYKYNCKMSSELVMPGPRRVVAHDLIRIRASRSGDFAPLEITLPKQIVDSMKLEKGMQIRIYTDGERGYFDIAEEPTI
jgi:hypothetical protein